MNKRVDRTTFIKNMLLNKNTDYRCPFCKYCTSNYKDVDMVMIKYFDDKCKHCIETFKLKKRKKPYWAEDNFKPLYDWES